MLLSNSKSTSESQNRVPSSQSDIAAILSDYLADSPLIRHAQIWPSARFTFRKKKTQKKAVLLSNLLTKGDTRFRTTSRQLLGSPRTPPIRPSLDTLAHRPSHPGMVHDGCLYPAQTFLPSQTHTEKKNCMSSTKQKVMAPDGNLLSCGSQGSFPLLTKTKCLYQRGATKKPSKRR